MTGLIYRDLFTYYRRSSKSTWITEIIVFFVFLLVIKGHPAFCAISYFMNFSSMPLLY